MSLDEFFEELKGIRFRLEEDGAIRTVEEAACRILSGCPYYHCPICALAAKKGLGQFTNGEVKTAATALGLSNEDRKIIINAADGKSQHKRKELLNACIGTA